MTFFRNFILSGTFKGIIVNHLYHLALISVKNDDGFCETKCTDTLILVHAIFRHGHRSPDRKYMAPSDPYYNEPFFPYGMGQLTNEGKAAAYKLGQNIRRRYNTFLGSVYNSDLVYAQSTKFDRTQMTLQLVLAGLFPPDKDTTWNGDLNWQPTLIHYTPKDADKVLYGFKMPKYREIYRSLSERPDVQEFYTQYADAIEHIRKHAGKEIKTFWDVFFIYCSAYTEEEWGLPLADWMAEIYPEPLYSMALINYRLQNYTIDLRRMISGAFCKKVIEDTKNKIKNPDTDKTKMYLYCAHEVNVAGVLAGLGLYEPVHIPPYTSCIFFEVHKINGTYGFKIFYYDVKTPRPRLLRMPGCGAFCPLDQFESILKDLLAPVC